MTASHTRQTTPTKIITHTPTQQLPTPYNHLNGKFTTFCLRHKTFVVKLKADDLLKEVKHKVGTAPKQH